MSVHYPLLPPIASACNVLLSSITSDASVDSILLFSITHSAFIGDIRHLLSLVTSGGPLSAIFSRFFVLLLLIKVFYLLFLVVFYLVLLIIVLYL